MARTSVKIGIFMLVAWVIPLLGIILAGIGLAQAVISLSGPQREMARAGIFLNSLGLILSLLLVAVSLHLLLAGVIDLSMIIN